jgi:dTDP-4-dehydrorhamnose reductase
LKIVVTGARGALGTEVAAAADRLGLEVVGLGREDLDVTDAPAVDARIAAESPVWVVHCAAYTDVDRAEEEPEHAMRVNRDGAANVARAAAGRGARTVYVSTDYVFDGEKRSPYSPSDPVGPLSVYGRTKLAGEEAVVRAVTSRDIAPLIVRTGWLYGAAGRNFVTGILDRAERGEDLRVVDDQRGRPTWARNVAEVVFDLVDGAVDGVWHVADGGEATWLDLAHEALRLRGLDVSVDGVSSEEWGAAAPRPAYSVMELAATERALGRPMMDWREALGRFLAGK